MLRGNVLRKWCGAQWVIGPENAGGYAQRHLEKRLEKILEGARVGCHGGEFRPEYGSGEVDMCLVVCVLGLVIVVVQCAVMVVISVLDGRLVEGGLLQGCVGATQPSERRNGLGEDYDQRQDMRGHGTDWSGIEEALMERPS